MVSNEWNKVLEVRAKQVCQLIFFAKISKIDEGCSSLYLTRSYPGNDWTSWQLGIIYIGGAGGRKQKAKRAKIGSGETAFCYEHVKPQTSIKNSMLLQNLHYKLPLDVVVESEDNCFMYLGSWYVDRVSVESGTMESNGFSFFRFQLASRVKYWEKMEGVQFTFPFKISMIMLCGCSICNKFLDPLLAKFLDHCTGYDVIHFELNNEGLMAVKSLGLSVDVNDFIGIIMNNKATLLNILHIPEVNPITPERIIAALNTFEI